jgi:hypothetical protein
MRTTSWNTAVATTAVAVLVLVNACSGSGGLSNSAAQKILDEAWGDQYHYILLGNVAVVADRDDIDHNRISSIEFKAVQAWAKAGLIDLKVRDVTVENFGVTNQFGELILNGVLKLIEVTPTQEGAALQASSELKVPLDSRFLYARLYRTAVSGIVENQEIKKDAELYRVVKGTVSTTWNAAGAKVYAAWGQDMPPQQRFIALLKFDPFEKAWKLSTYDAANGDGKFDSDNVGAALGK